MYRNPIESNTTTRQLREIMLGYLQAARSVASWPGGDGLTIDDVLDFYAEAVAKGQVPDWAAIAVPAPGARSRAQRLTGCKGSQAIRLPPTDRDDFHKLVAGLEDVKETSPAYDGRKWCQFTFFRG